MKKPDSACYTENMDPVSIYIHIPFCSHRCGYCDFNTYAGLNHLIPSYVQSLCKEIDLLSSDVKDKITAGTIYFGGGTPSLLPLTELEKIITKLDEKFIIQRKPEITIEANPGTVTRQYLIGLRSLGVNRISLGMQSADRDELIILDRQHSFDDVINAVEWSRNAGINNLNLDLIYGIPGQEMHTWLKNLSDALSLSPEHLSLYALTIEEGTPMHAKYLTGLFQEPDQDLVADMYDAASERLEIAGFHQYEISNWAKQYTQDENYTCIHNLQYWRTLPYIGFGAGAHGFIHHLRTVNVLTPGEYINRLNQHTRSSEGKLNFPRTPATKQAILVDYETEMGETMMLGLRLVSEGVSENAFRKRFGISLRQRYESQITDLISLGLLEWADIDRERLRLTHKARLIGNQVFKEFI